jgi:hypothetical protein
MDEVDGEDAAGLCGEELLPGQACAAGCWADPGIMQDVPDRGGGDRVAELDEFALHAAVPRRGANDDRLTAAVRVTGQSPQYIVDAALTAYFDSLGIP